MSISVAWDNPEHTVILLNLPTRWDWNDISHIQTEFEAMINMEPHTVDVIFDLSYARLIPKDAFSNIRNFSYASPATMGLIVLVKANLLSQTMVNQARKLFPQWKVHVDFADTLEEARILLAKKRAQRVSEAGIEPAGADGDLRTV